MQRPLRTLLCLLLSCLLAGGHWAVLQGIAWVRMADGYVAAYGLVRGLKMTVSGEKPCAMCKTISRARTDEGRTKAPLAPGGQKDELKPSAVIANPASAPHPRETGATRWAVFHPVSGSAFHRPEVPPPRRLS